MTVTVYVGEALARYGFGQGHPFGPDRMGAFWQRMIDRGLDRRVQVCDRSPPNATTCCAFTPRVRRSGDPPVGNRAGLSGSGRHAGLSRCLRSRLLCGRQRAGCRGPAHGRRAPPGLRADRRPAPRAARQRRRVSACSMTAASPSRRCAAVTASGASPTSTSTPTTATGSFMRSSDDPELILADLHEDGRYPVPRHRGRRGNRRGAAAGHQAQSAHAAGGRRRRLLRASGRRSSPIWSGFRPRIHPVPVRRRQPGRRPHHPSARIRRRRTARRRPPVRARGPDHAAAACWRWAAAATTAGTWRAPGRAVLRSADRDLTAPAVCVPAACRARDRFQYHSPLCHRHAGSLECSARP